MINASVSVISFNGTGPGIASLDNQWTEKLKTVYLNIGPMVTWCLLGAGVFGVIGNILTFHVYRKLGFSSTIHMSYAALAVSDLLCVLANMVNALKFLQLSLHFSAQTTEQLLRITGGYPHFVFSRTSALLTAWISLERCLCVIFPTRVKVMITRALTKVVIVVIFLLGGIPLVLLYQAYKIEWQFDPNANTTSVALLFHDKRTMQRKLQSVAVFLFGVVYPLISCVTVAVCTTFLIIRLKQSTKWRSLNAPDASNLAKVDPETSIRNSRQQMSARDIRVTRVVIVVASVFLLCSLPVAAQLLAVFTVHGYSSTGSLRYLYGINGMFTVLFSQLNSSLNIIIFSVTGQKFRSVLLQVISWG